MADEADAPDAAPAALPERPAHPSRLLAASREDEETAETVASLRKRPRVVPGPAPKTAWLQRDRAIQAQRLLLPILKEEHVVGARGTRP